MKPKFLWTRTKIVSLVGAVLILGLGGWLLWRNGYIGAEVAVKSPYQKIASFTINSEHIQEEYSTGRIWTILDHIFYLVRIEKFNPPTKLIAYSLKDGRQLDIIQPPSEITKILYINNYQGDLYLFAYVNNQYNIVVYRLSKSDNQWHEYGEKLENFHNAYTYDTLFDFINKTQGFISISQNEGTTSPGPGISEYLADFNYSNGEWKTHPAPSLRYLSSMGINEDVARAIGRIFYFSNGDRNVINIDVYTGHINFGASTLLSRNSYSQVKQYAIAQIENTIYLFGSSSEFTTDPQGKILTPGGMFNPKSEAYRVGGGTAIGSISRKAFINDLPAGFIPNSAQNINGDIYIFGDDKIIGKSKIYKFIPQNITYTYSFQSADYVSRDAQRKADLAKLKTAIDKYYSQNKELPITDGWIEKKDAGKNTNESLAETLLPSGMIDKIPSYPKPGKPYMYYRDDSCRGDKNTYSLYARLDKPTEADLATINDSSIKCNKGVKKKYGMNYRVGN